jgi:hypothetical protein
MKKLFESYLNHLRDLSYRHSDERREFAKIKLIAHHYYMEGLRKTTPFLHPDDWQDDNESQLANMNKL